VAATKKVSFEEALKELEMVIERLEREDLTLSDSLEYFQKGVGLMRVCDTHLKSAEGTLKEILKGENGAFVEKILGHSADALNEERPCND
jgi:exodeoxyribonuclease VII small subunit